MRHRSRFLKEKTPMSKTFLWMTDIHLNFLKENAVVNWAQFAHRQAKNANCEGVIISGDISEGNQIQSHLKILATQIGLPLYYVHGNHDYWHTSRENLFKDAKLLEDGNPQIKWLGASDVIPVTEKTALVGHDGWYDAMAGDWTTSSTWMRDWDKCHDFIPLRPNKGPAIGLGRLFAADAIAFVSNQIDKALLGEFETIMIVTHFPPFAAAARHNGMPNDPDAAPYYCCVSMGEMLKDKALANPTKKFVVLSGHTHDAYRHDEMDNLTVYVGGAEYGQPSFQTINIG